MAEKFDEFLEEIEGDIRQEKLQKLWKDYGKIVIGVAIAVLAFANGYMIWQNHKVKQNELISEHFVGAQQLLEDGKLNEAVGVMDALSKRSHKGYAFLAQFVSAAALAKDGTAENIAKAKETYRLIANDKSIDRIFCDLASIFWVNLESDTIKSTQKGELKQCLDILEPLLHKDNPWRCLAMETKSLLLYKNGQISEAVDLFTALAQDPKASEQMRERARLMSQSLAGQVVAK
ncbi:MAG: tetratricopeptide repeat protein [Alphaproteobacteria bacterium]|nr:tetratricopeptide repeat protein [Alphaproteobacteria bacterium]